MVTRQLIFKSPNTKTSPPAIDRCAECKLALNQTARIGCRTMPASVLWKSLAHRTYGSASDERRKAEVIFVLNRDSWCGTQL